ncbi:hypothetical protein SCHPADRAFT_658044 [Schizopora paradoxa]|uniref:BTB domain-containing protein n=1 Tax=Schizopora paradoxa TaxID=27342 RepID=A0A0H2RCH9_9AGAM|nr:hypothetical protein SCHPADRAFT_658044 [Schizopora paradoxa]
MNMPPKRRRLSKDSQVGDGGEQQGAPTTQPRRHDELWFSDGSIVLATDVHLYRVHKSMLAKYSKVLRDLFEIPTGDEDANTERWEDVPIVRMVGDSDEEVRLLLKSLYGVNLQVALRGLSLTEVASLLSISSKYDCQDIRTDVMQRLEHLFPSKLEIFQGVRILRESLPPSQVFELLVVAHRCEALSILPVLYFLCARLPLETIIGVMDLLPKDCMSRLLLGREWLLNSSHAIRQRSLQSSRVGGQNSKICRSSKCLEKFRAQLSEQPFAFIFDIPDNGVMEGLDVKTSEICEDCADRHIGLMGGLKQLGWDDLPMKFLGKSWEELGKTNDIDG